MQDSCTSLAVLTSKVLSMIVLYIIVHILNVGAHIKLIWTYSHILCLHDDISVLVCFCMYLFVVYMYVCIC